LIHFHGGGHVHLLLVSLFSILGRASLLFKITLNGWDTPDGIRRGKWGLLALKAFMRLDAVVAMTSGQAETCRKFNYAGRLDVIPNAVDCDRFCPVDPQQKHALRDSLGLARFDHVLVYAGVLDYRKGTDILLATFQQLLLIHPGLGLLLVGDFMTADMQDEELARTFRIEENSVIWESIVRVGRVSHVENYLHAADLFVFPSRQEGFGTVQIEAMACGLPCVVGDIPGVTRDIFPNDQVGRVINRYEAESFAQVISELLLDPSERNDISLAARRYAVEHYSVDHVAGCYLNLYRRLLDNY
jgi:glycosyltransferase involved in cell wall biosynthesis